jgi:hypothetical protein
MGKGWRIVAEVSGVAALGSISVMAPDAPLKMGLSWSDREAAIKRWGPAIMDRWESKLAIVVASDRARRTALAAYHHDGQFYFLRFTPR